MLFWVVARLTMSSRIRMGRWLTTGSCPRGCERGEERAQHRAGNTHVATVEADCTVRSGLDSISDNHG